MEISKAELERLVRAAKQRDHEAFLTLVGALHPRLSARARAYAGDAAAAEDLLQETYLRAYENLNTLRDPGAIISWMLTILDRLAQREAQKPAEESLPDEIEAAGAEAAAQNAMLEIGEHAEELQLALARLPASDRELLALRFGANMNAIQIAQELKSTPAAVRMRLCRVVARLREIMGVTQ